jgi:hypothetical protein
MHPRSIAKKNTTTTTEQTNKQTKNTHPNKIRLEKQA